MALETVVLLLGGAASISTLIMFFSWLHERKEKVKQIFSTSVISALLASAGAVFAWLGMKEYSLYSYSMLWVFLSVIFFRTDMQDAFRFKAVLFNLILVSVLLALLLSVSLTDDSQQQIDGLTSQVESLTEIIGKIVDNIGQMNGQPENASE